MQNYVNYFCNNDANNVAYIGQKHIELCNLLPIMYARTYKVGSKMQPKIVVLLPFIATFGSKVYQNPRKNIRVSKA